MADASSGTFTGSLLEEVARDCEAYYGIEDLNARDDIYQRFNSMAVRLSEILFTEAQVREMIQGIQDLRSKYTRGSDAHSIMVDSILELMALSLTIDLPEVTRRAPPSDKVPTEDIKTKLLEIDRYIPKCRNKVRRFAHLLVKQLEPEVSPDGFIWACERALFDIEGDFELIDRKKIRDELPYIVERIFKWDFAEMTNKILAEIEQGTTNLD